jgi:acyl carrier protein
MKEESALTARLIARIAEVCKVDIASLSRETRTDDIGLDSMSLTQILATMEAEFGIELADEDVFNLLEARSIDDYANVLNARAAR